MMINCKRSLNLLPAQRAPLDANTIDDTLIAYLDSMVQVYEQWKSKVITEDKQESYVDNYFLKPKAYSDLNWYLTL